MPKFTVPLTVTPRDAHHCGACPGCGYSWSGDYCVVFREQLKFFDQDPDCLQNGYRRCAACRIWERQHQGNKGNT